jgi:hypothetical protein
MALVPSLTALACQPAGRQRGKPTAVVRIRSHGMTIAESSSPSSTRNADPLAAGWSPMLFRTHGPEVAEQRALPDACLTVHDEPSAGSVPRSHQQPTDPGIL